MLKWAPSNKATNNNMTAPLLYSWNSQKKETHYQMYPIPYSIVPGGQGDVQNGIKWIARQLERLEIP